MATAAAKKKPPAKRSAGRPRKFTHEQIVQAALAVMEREGFAALTLRSLAAELGISHSVLYNYVENIEDVEAEALQHLATLIPMPRPGTPRELRKQTIDCLLIVRDVLLKHPGVLHPPMGSAAWNTFGESVVQWVIALTPYTASADAAVIGHGALLNAVAHSAEIQRTYGSQLVTRLPKLLDKRLPPPKTLQFALEHLIDTLFPGFPKSK